MVNARTSKSNGQSGLQLGFKQYERHVSALLFFVGAFADVFFLPRIDAGVTYVVLGVYLVVVTIALVASAVITERGLHSPRWLRFSTFLNFFTALVIGSLLSAVFVYYTRSSSLLVSFPFLILLFFIMLLTEIARNRLRQLELRMALLYFILVMNMTFAVPVLLGAVGPIIFLVSILLALCGMSVLMLVLATLTPHVIHSGRTVLLGSILGITVLITTLYFFRVIPPIPLALRVAEVSYGASRLSTGDYQVLIDKEKEKNRSFFSTPTVQTSGEPLYFYSAVFAPTKLTTSIVHVWQFYDEPTSSWRTRQRISYPISGGREYGYRGYSSVLVNPGKWRVRVETTRGEVLGVEGFNVVLATTPVFLETRVR